MKIPVLLNKVSEMQESKEEIQNPKFKNKNKPPWKVCMTFFP